VPLDGTAFDAFAYEGMSLDGDPLASPRMPPPQQRRRPPPPHVPSAHRRVAPPSDRQSSSADADARSARGSRLSDRAGLPSHDPPPEGSDTHLAPVVDSAAPGAEAAAAADMQASLEASTVGANGRNSAERKEWTVSEDAIIRASVATHGCRWRKIAAQLPGRSDDAVRNRWNRLKDMGADSANASAGTAVTAAADAPVSLPLPAGMAPVSIGGTAGASASSSSRGRSEGASKPERVSWTKAEDETILSSVRELGHKWNKIAERLPGRTDHAIRNRFHRLQSLLEDRQRQQQRVLAPSVPLPIAPASITSGGALAGSSEGSTPAGEASGFETPQGSTAASAE